MKEPQDAQLEFAVSVFLVLKLKLVLFYWVLVSVPSPQFPQFQ